MIHENDSEKESRDGSTEEDADEEEEKEEKELSDHSDDNLIIKGPVINTYGRRGRGRDFFSSSDDDDDDDNIVLD